MSVERKDFLEFGSFRIDCQQRVLLRDGEPLSLTPKAFDTLLVLARNSARIVEREELINAVWPDSFFEVAATRAFNICCGAWGCCWSSRTVENKAQADHLRRIT